MNIYVKGKLVVLSPGDLLGSGGEANVFAKNGKAYKIFHTTTQNKIGKIQALMGQRLPKAVLAPEELVFSKAGKVIGYEMQLSDPAAEPLKMLSNRNFRLKNQIGIPETVAIFSDFHATLTALHALGNVVGDLNDLNELFLGKDVYFIDSDSFQVAGFACEVATEDFLCPTLYDLDLTGPALFTEETDWYSYGVLLYRSLLLVHPYGGVYPGVTKIPERARQKLTILNPKVRYPKIGINPEILSDELLTEFRAIFEAGKYGTFPLSALTDFGDQLRKCPACGEPFWSKRKNCPVCSQAVLVPVAKITGHYRIQTVFETDGFFVHSEVTGGKIYAVANENGELFLYTWRGTEKKTALFPESKGLVFGTGAGKLLVGKKGSGNMVLVDPDTGKPTLKTETDLFSNYPVFAGTTRFVYRIASGFLLRGELTNAGLVERPIASVLEGQTWFAADDQNGDERVFIAGRFFENWDYRVITDNLSHEVQIASLAKAEKLIRLSVRFGEKDVLVMRETKEKGKKYLRLDLVDDKGTSKRQIRREWVDGFEGVFTGAYHKGTLVYSGDDGLAAIHSETDTEWVFEDTDAMTDGNEKLYYWRGKILAIGEKKARFLEKGA